MLSFFAVVAVVALTSASRAAVVDLDSKNFDKLVDGSKHTLVEFFAPWCGHCKNLAPHYEELGTLFEREADVLIAKVDADKHKELGGRFGVSGFPTLKWFPKGSTTAEDFNGGRDTESMAKWINDKVGSNVRVVKPPTAVKVLTEGNFDGVVKDASKDVLVEFFAPWCGHCKALAPKYEKVAKIYADESAVAVASVDCDANGDLCQQYGVSGYPTIKFFPRGDKSGEAYEGGREVDDFVSFLNSRAGTERTAAGGLTDKAGRIPELDALAADFRKNKDAVLARIDDVVAGLHLNEVRKSLATYYKTVMKQVVDKGEAFIETEIARLEKMISSKSIAGSKISDFARRLNILKQF